MSIYAKLQKARKLLNDSDLQKSGKNAFGTGFKYFELKDFMPKVNEIFADLGLLGATDFSGETMATLTIYDTDELTGGACLVFSCPKAEAGLRQGTPIQNVGAVQTYIRRYLWVQAMEITEDDQIDALADDQKISQTDINKQRQKTEAPPPPTLPQLKAKLEGAKDLPTLTAVWSGIPNKYKVQELINLKDACKAKLQGPSVEDKIMGCKTKDDLIALCNTLPPGDEAKYDLLIGEKMDEFMGIPAP